MQRIIFHVDVNSAFLSWEAAKRVREGEQDIRLIPAAIGGDRDKRTGVILAKSIPAKKYGVTTGEPVAMALRKCPDLFLAKPDFRLYERNSRAFMDICRKYAPAVEKYSIDECFLDMTGTEKLYGDPVELARRIKDEIRATLGFTVNIGVANNKLLAKMASDFEKPDKVHTLFDGEIREKLWPLRVGELYGRPGYGEKAGAGGYNYNWRTGKGQPFKHTGAAWAENGQAGVGVCQREGRILCAYRGGGGKRVQHIHYYGRGRCNGGAGV